MFIALGMVGIYAICLNNDINFVRFWILRIESKIPVKFSEITVKPAHTQMLDTKFNKGVLANRIDFIVSGYCRACTH
ncbi:hypothetical protein XBJ1_1352 [Xenorhabdus bovienii SS-2004]|uniref:Uncharacterized protein n=1 Tax=Xenorhabdus bovienii (strain SS-2004) TaxID=406818 RepID=D3UXW0_XENBS|nr:hypothetical protein XBJ1_1352 [Xenorhabdus bovienii SS-2004]